MTMHEPATPSGAAGLLPSSRATGTGAHAAPPRITPPLAMGVVLMALGTLLTLDRLEIVDAARTVRYWPAGLIAVGLAMWVRGQGARGRFWGSVWIVIGSWLLLNTLGIVQVGLWELFWPLVLVFVGLRLVLHTSRTRAAPATGSASLFAMLGECNRSTGDAPFRSGQMTAFMGGCRLDLRQATIAPGEEATIDVSAFMGGLEVWVPAGWTIVSDDVVPILGAVEDKRLPLAATAGPESPPRLRLRGHVMMGALTIKN